MAHTVETVRVACIQAGILLDEAAPVVAPCRVGAWVATWLADTAGGGRIRLGETNNGELWYDSRRIYPAGVRSTTPKATLEEQVRVLRAALAPFGAFGEAMEYSTGDHDLDVAHTAAGTRVLVGDYRRAIAALAALS